MHLQLSLTCFHSYLHRINALRYAWRMQEPVENEKQNRGWLWLLLLPVVALIFPSLYNRETPTLFGFPFFYWYQLLWVFIATAILGLVYKLVKD